MHTKLLYELDGVVDLKVIIPVTEPTEWCSQISVPTKKGGKLRICIDPRHLNEVLQRENYQLPTIDDLLPELVGPNAKVFSKVDLSNGYWHWGLDETSSNTLRQIPMVASSLRHEGQLKTFSAN